MTRTKKGKRVYLSDTQTRDLMKQLDTFFESTVEIPRIQVGKKQSIESLMNEEALLFANFLGNEQDKWMPRT